MPPNGAAEKVLSQIFMKAVILGKLENRFLKNEALICLSEKGLAALGSLSVRGEMDYHCFRSVDEASIQ